MKFRRIAPMYTDGTPNTWASLDQWMVDLIEEWDGKLPRALRLNFEPNMLLLKAAELGTPHSTQKILDRYALFMTPIRDAVNQDLTADERKLIEDHVSKYEVAQ